MVMGFVGEEEIKLDLVKVDGIGRDEFVEVLPLIHDGFISGEVRTDRFVEEGFKRFHKLFFIAPLIHQEQQQQILSLSSLKPFSNLLFSRHYYYNAYNRMQNNHQLCFLCTKHSQPLPMVITQSLCAKYSHPSNYLSSNPIDPLVEEQVCSDFVQFQQYEYLDEEEEYLKRQYKEEEYEKKIKMLSQYYKFHRNVPTWNANKIDVVMAKYYSKLKDADYKRIKKVLKKEQNISISTHKSFSSFDDSFQTKKSQYSSVLNELYFSKNQSALLLDICDKIGKAFKKTKKQPDFKGHFPEHNKFQNYLNKITKKKKNDGPFMKMKERMIGGKGRRKERIKISEKTTENETIEKEERIKLKRQQSNALKPANERFLSNKRILKSESSHRLKMQNVIDLIGNQKLKTINEIYRSKEPETIKRQNRKISIRCESQKHLSKDTTKRKVERSCSQKLLKGKERDEERLKCRSFKRMDSRKKIESMDWKSRRTSEYFSEKKNQVIKQILDKKLALFKKKPSVLDP